MKRKTRRPLLETLEPRLLLTTAYAGSTTITNTGIISLYPPATDTTTASSPYQPAISLTVTPGPYVIGAPQIYTAVITPPPEAAQLQATGTVIFRDGSTIIGSSTLSGGYAQLTLSPSVAASQLITASYLGDQNFNAVVSDPLPLSIQKADATSSISFGIFLTTIVVTLTPTSPTSNLAPPNGIVYLYDGENIVYQAATSQSSVTFYNVTQGSHLFHVQYFGDSHFNAFISPTVSMDNFPQTATSLALTSNVSAITRGQPITFTATIADQDDLNGPPQGTIEFDSDGQFLASVTVSNAQAVLTTSMLTVGTHSLQAYFHPTSYHLDSSTFLSNIKVVAPATTIIDILALWTVNSGNNPNTISQQIKDSIAAANTAFANSQIPITIRLVGISAIPPAPTHIGETYFIHTLDRDLTFLDNPADGVWDNIPQLKATFGADAVVLFDTSGEVSTGGLDTVGISYELDPNNPNRSQNALAVIDSRMPADSYVLAHELGHILGATHAVNDPTPNGATAYAHGYRFTGSDGVLYHDIMAYDPGTLVPYFSSPDLTYAGVALGDASTADASRTIREFAPSVAAYHAAPAILGTVDVANANQIAGWAYDPKSMTAPTTIRIFIDGTLRATISADASRPDLYAYLGSATHGFSYTLTNLTPGYHGVNIYALDTLTNAPTLLASRTLLVANAPPTGYIDLLDAGHIAGWTLDRNTPSVATKVALKIDGILHPISFASQIRNDLTPLFGAPNHGFNLTLPTLSRGNHRIELYVADTTTGLLTMLASRVLTIAPPRGAIDILNSTQIAGWAFAPSTPGTPIAIRCTIDNTTVFIPAADARPDLLSALGSASHAFTYTLPTLTPGTHHITLDAYDPTTRLLTTLATQSITV